MRFEVTPMGKPRMTQRDKWAKRDVVLRYFAYKDELNLHANRQQFGISEQLKVDFYLPMPTSWSKKKQAQMDGKPHQQKPDIDNLVKAFMDSLTDDDSFVWEISARKFWAKEGRIEVK